jgi:death on curing protein
MTTRYLASRDLASLAELEAGAEVHADLLALEEIAELPATTNSSGRDAYPGVHVKAAVLLSELLRRRPFDRVNDAVALLAAIVFLNLNGYDVTAGDGELAELVTLAAEGNLTVLMVAAAFESATARLDVTDADAEV